MLATLTEKLLVAALGVAMLVGTVLALYAGYEHMQTQKLEIVQLQKDNAQEKANTAAALQAASAVSAALDVKTEAVAVATKNQAATTARLNAAAKANPAASVVVPDAVWAAIYGDTNAK